MSLKRNIETRSIDLSCKWKSISIFKSPRNDDDSSMLEK